MIRFLMPLLSGVLVAGLASAAPLIIDDFSLDQGPIQAAYSNPASDTVTNDGSFIGPAGTSTRTIDVNGNGHPPPSGQWTTAEVGGGMFEFTSAADVLGNTSLVYEFIGGVDLSKHIGFTFHDVFADHPFDYEVRDRKSVV